MATFPCDYTDCPELADVIVSRIDNGETTTWCDLHYVAVCRAIADAVDSSEAEATDTAAVATLEAAGPAGDPPTSPESSDEGGAPAGEPGKPVDGTESDGAGSDATPEAVAAPGPS